MVERQFENGNGVSLTGPILGPVKYRGMPERLPTISAAYLLGV
jgi:hypothetical protein